MNLAGTLALVIGLTLALGVYFTYQSLADNEASLQRLEANLTYSPRCKDALPPLTRIRVRKGPGYV